MFRTVNVTDKIILQKKLGGYFCQADIFLGGKGSAALMCCMTYYVFHLYLTIPSLAHSILRLSSSLHMRNHKKWDSY